MKILLLDIYRMLTIEFQKIQVGVTEQAIILVMEFYQLPKKKFKEEHDWPPLFLAYTHAVLKKFSHNIIYSKNINKKF